MESEVCDEFQNEDNENINIDIPQKIPLSENDVDKLKKKFLGEKWTIAEKTIVMCS